MCVFIYIYIYIYTHSTHKKHPDPKASQKCLSWDSSQIVARDPPKNAWLRADGMLDTACNDAAASWRKKRLLLKCAAVAAWGEEGGGEGRHCCGSGEILVELLREQTLLRQWGSTERLLRERALLRQWGNIDNAPAGADTAAAVGRY